METQRFAVLEADRVRGSSVVVRQRLSLRGSFRFLPGAPREEGRQRPLASTGQGQERNPRQLRICRTVAERFRDSVFREPAKARSPEGIVGGGKRIPPEGQLGAVDE